MMSGMEKHESDIVVAFTPAVHHEDSVCWAEIVNMPGCFMVADTLDEPLSNLMEAMTCWLETVDADKQAKGRVECLSVRSLCVML